ncbi:GNAT family N-acetyltransferase [Paenibacillus yonginensis]|uniref:GNAT family N-acetyltransferase n=1 Tax=Paenibacillus yonginensis TaxID=1462996 RepID=UPI001244D15B|nr:GNAT family N-acetyltransferase [Paenibacillus yonginensis]
MSSFEVRSLAMSMRCATFQVVGFASVRPVGGFLELEDLFTDPDWMRQGVASALIANITHRGLHIEVSANPLVLGFYESVGFVVRGVADTEGGPVPRMYHGKQLAYDSAAFQQAGIFNKC